MMFACGATPESANVPPAKDALFTTPPAAVLAVCEPWPSVSAPLRPAAVLTKLYMPISLLLQWPTSPPPAAHVPLNTPEPSGLIAT